MKDKVTASDVCAALRRHFHSPEWALMFEVRNSTGFAANRSADAVAMSLWPSRGLELWGMEIKVNRYDWQRELSNPKKAEAIAAYCDRWFLVTGPDVINDVSELPIAWGWYLLVGDKLVQKKQATVTAAKSLDRPFLGALLRRASEMDEALIETEVRRRAEQQNVDFEKRVEEAVKRRMANRDDIVRDVEQFEEASGIKITESFRSPKDIGRAVKAILDSGIDSMYAGAMSTVESLRRSADIIEKSFKEMGLPPREVLEPKKRKRL